MTGGSKKIRLWKYLGVRLELHGKSLLPEPHCLPAGPGEGVVYLCSLGLGLEGQWHMLQCLPESSLFVPQLLPLLNKDNTCSFLIELLWKLKQLMNIKCLEKHPHILMSWCPHIALTVTPFYREEN